MNTTEAIRRLRDVIRRQNKALATEESYVHWLRRYMTAIQQMPNSPQEAMGHQSLETTMGYLHADSLSVPSPLDG